MKFHLGRHYSVYIFFTITLAFAVGLIESLDRSQKSFLRDSLLARAKEELSIIRSELEAAIVSDIYVANGLSALVAANPEFEFSGWDLIASSIMRKSSHVIVIGLAPDDVIKFIYPKEGNEKALGLNYKTIPSQWRTVRKAQEVQEIFIAGPVNLVQGGQGLIARVPIFSDPPYNLEYWGVCSVVMSLESLFRDVGLQKFEFRYDLAMRGTDSTGGDGAIFYGKAATFHNAFAVESVHFPYGSWVIAASQREDLLLSAPWYRVHAVRMIGYPMMLVLLLAFSAIYRLYIIANQRSLQDELTNLPNRRYFMYTLHEHFKSAENAGGQASFALMNIDLDSFKAINDTYGHTAGDKVLVAVAQRLKGSLRSSDVIARMGGDEYLVLLPRLTKAEDAEAIHQQIHQAICATPVIYEQHLIEIKASIGLVIYNDEIDSVEEMLKRADSRMYQAKRRSVQVPSSNRSSLR